MKKKILSIVITLCMIISLMPAISFTASAIDSGWSYPTSDPGEFSVGDGTEGNPYIISTAQELANLAYRVNNGSNYSGKYLALTANIVLNDNVLAADGTLNSGSFTTWTPIGNSPYNFRGTFDGNDHTISGIYINNSATNYTGLFGNIYGNSIKNVGVADSCIIGGDFVGGVVANASHSTVENCYYSGRISGNNYVGGLAGIISYTKVNNCHNDGRIDANENVGGIVGQDNAVSGSTTLISNCYNTGTINASKYVGGIVGDNFKDISNCYNIGTITASTSTAGGISGICSVAGTITACFNTGSVNTSFRGGGIAGYLGGVIQTSCNCGSISSSGSDMGGIVGWTTGGTVQNCYNAGCVTGSSHVGGVVGYSGSATVTSCYYDKQMCTRMYGIGSPESSTGAEGKLTSEIVGVQLQDVTASNPWGSSNWVFAEGLYPRLVNMDATEAAIIYAAPVVLSNSDTVNSVTGDFTFSTANGVEWDSDNAAISIPSSGTTAGVTRDSSSDTEVTLTATLGSLSRSISLTVAHMVLSGTSSITVTNGYGDSSNQIKIGATLTATANTTPDTNLSYQWQVSADGSDGWTSATGTGNNTAEYTVTSSDVTKYLRVAVTSTDAPGTVYSASSAQVPYTITLSQSGNTGSDAVSFSDSSTVTTTYEVSGTVAIYYTLDNSGTMSNTISYSGGTITQITTSGTGSSSYTVSSGDAVNGVIAITATFVHTSFSGGGDSPYIPPTPTFSNDVPVIINGKSCPAGTSKTAIENGQTQTTVTVDTDKLEGILDSEGDGTTVIIPFANDPDRATGFLTGQMVKKMEEKEAILEVQTGAATYTLPASEINIDTIAEQFGEYVDLSDIEVEITIAEPSDATVQIVENAAKNGEFSIMVQAVEFSVTCTYAGQTVEVLNYNAYVQRTIAIPDGVDHTKITTAVVVDTYGTVRHVPTEVVEKSGVYYAVINSLTNSVYTLINNPVEFADVEGHWAQNAINDMGSRLVVTGDENGNFNPDNSITRAEFAATIVRALGLSEGTGENTFSDISDDDWYCGYIETASAYGIITGYTDCTFGPNDKITREQAMTIIARAMIIPKLDANISDSAATALLEKYSDSADISHYARDSAAACIEAGIISGKGSEILAPTDNMSRAEVAVIVQRFLQKSGLI